MGRSPQLSSLCLEGSELNEYLELPIQQEFTEHLLGVKNWDTTVTKMAFPDLVEFPCSVEGDDKYTGSEKMTSTLEKIKQEAGEEWSRCAVIESATGKVAFEQRLQKVRTAGKQT